MSLFTCRLILCTDAKNGIGKNNEIPWDVPVDRRIFYDTTTRQYGISKAPNIVVVGRATWKSIPSKHRGLMKRITFVLSKTMTQTELEDDNTRREEVYLVRSFHDIAAKLLEFQSTGREHGFIFIAGGAQVYQQAIRKCKVNAIYHTSLLQDYGCDVFCDIPGLKNNLSANMCSLWDREPIQKKLRYNDAGDVLVFTLYTSFNVAGNAEEQQYLDILAELINAPLSFLRETRNAPAFTKCFRTLSFDLWKSFPLYTTKRVFFRGVVEELLFFLSGSTDTKLLEAKGVNIWKKNTSAEFIAGRGLSYREGDMGPSYGFALRHYGASYNGCDADYTGQGFDQVAHCLHLLKTDPFSRRITMTTYDPLAVSKCVLPPCHGLSIMFDVNNSHELSCTVVLRSNDWCCGNPFNVASYALLVHCFIYAMNNDMSYVGPKFQPGMLNMVIHNAHLYHEHVETALLQCTRVPLAFPTLVIKEKQLDASNQFPSAGDITLKDYRCHPSLTYEMIA